MLLALLHDSHDSRLLSPHLSLAPALCLGPPKAEWRLTCSFVLTTSSGQVITAPIVPPTLSEWKGDEDQIAERGRRRKQQSEVDQSGLKTARGLRSVLAASEVEFTEIL
jgi:hypothetical protein